MTERLARAAARRPWLTIAAWIVALAAAVVSTGAFIGSLSSEQRLTNHPESYRAAQLQREHFRDADQVDEIVVIRSDEIRVDDDRFAQFVRALAERLRGTGVTSRVVTYYDTRDPSLVSRDRQATMAPIVMGANGDEGIARVIEVVQQADRADDAFTTAITGTYTIDRDFNELAIKDLKEGEIYFGAPAALIILLIVFGALVAATLPLVLSVFAIMLALGLSALVAQAVELSIFLQNMVTAVGLALGIDYSLFVLSRYREERARGREKLEAIAAAGSTASRAVLFSGTAFVIAMLGLLLVPDNIMRSLATGAILVGIVAVLAALTLLPALLSLLGDRVNAVRIPLVSRAVTSGEREARFWSRIAAAVMRRPVVSLAAATALLLALAYPVVDLRTGFASVSTFPESMVSKQGLEALGRDFRAGRADPVQIVIAGDIHSAPVAFGIDRLERQVRADPRFGPVEERIADSRRLAVLATPLPGGATDPVPIAAVRELREDYIPHAFRGAEAEVLVGGETAEDIDYFETMDRWLPIVVSLVLGLSFVLLTIAFRSIVVALKAILLNLLSAGAAYGLLVLVFEKGVGNELLGFTQVDSVVAWVPLFLFCVLFGLSMDYHVFLLSRIRERFAATGNNSESVAWGVSTTARLITGAALIIIVVFIGFAMGDLVMFQQMGFGVAAALLIDATIVRSVLVPAAMELLGSRNWYLPRWLQWLPHYEVEGPARR